MTLTAQVTTAWWLPLYLRTLVLFCLTMGTTPDMAKVQRVILRSLKVKLVLNHQQPPCRLPPSPR